MPALNGHARAGLLTVLTMNLIVPTVTTTAQTAVTVSPSATARRGPVPARHACLSRLPDRRDDGAAESVPSARMAAWASS